MSVLDDLQKLDFGQGIADTIKQMSVQYLTSQLQGELEQIKAEQTEPTPTQETINSAYPNANFGELPKLMRELDRTQMMLRKKADIYGKFIPSIALLNPTLARTIAEEQLKGESTALIPLKEKANLVEAQARINATSENAKQNRLIKLQQMGQQLETFKARQGQQQAQFDRLMRWRESMQRQHANSFQIGLFNKVSNQLSQNIMRRNTLANDYYKEWDIYQKKVSLGEDTEQDQQHLASTAAEVTQMDAQIAEDTMELQGYATSTDQPNQQLQLIQKKKW